MGHVETELDIFNSTLLLDAFKKSKILPSDTTTKSDAYNLIKRYLFEQMSYIPGGDISLSSRLSHAFSSMVSLVTEFSLPYFNFPIVLMSKLTEQVKSSVEMYLRETS